MRGVEYDCAPPPHNLNHNLTLNPPPPSWSRKGIKIKSKIKSKIMIKNGAHGLQLFPGFGACSVFGTSSLFSTTGEPLRSLNNPELATLSPAFSPFSTVT